MVKKKRFEITFKTGAVSRRTLSGRALASVAPIWRSKEYQRKLRIESVKEIKPRK